ncbi:MAG TPA: glycosyltransferase family 4 protein [Alphaproteobacteria bacterium]|nr:glycosyltransferase family 4 protein [Alphaproteobacteria bacterium]
MRSDEPSTAPQHDDTGGDHRPTVLQVLPSLVTGGAERGCVDMAAAIVEAGGRALVASSGGPMTHELARSGAEHVTLPLKSKNPFRIRANAAQLHDLIRRERVDLVHARSRAPAWSAYFAARRAGVPFVTTFHAPYNLGALGKRFYNGVMARGQRVIAISDFVARYVLENYRIDPSILRVIPRGVDIAKFDPERVSAERVIKLARDWRLPDGVPVVLAPARLTRWKGQLVLLDALAALGRDDLRCLIVGSDQGRTGYRRELEAKIARLGLEGVVHLTDHCDDMPAAYKLSDVVVSPTIEPEGFGRTIVEAQAMGRPVIATNIGAPPETVLQGETGWLVPPGDVPALAGAMAEALALDGGQREWLADRAIRHVRDNYTREKMCNDTLSVYEELLEERESG